MTGRLDAAMARLAESMVETREDIRRLYEAWPAQMRMMTKAADDVRRRSSETDASMINELRGIAERLDRIEKKLP